MGIRKWEKLPEALRCDEVRPYYDILRRHTAGLAVKRLFDLLAALLLLLLLSPAFLLLSLAIALDSRGGVFFRQTRVTTYGREFRIFKFRTMVQNAEQLGSQVTTSNDLRVTRVGRLLRGCRLDELPQLLNVLAGDMTFVGTRPEVVKYVRAYTPEMRATLLLPAGITSEASICYKDESDLLDASDDVDRTYIEEVLPGKMYYNLKALREFSVWNEFLLLFRTVGAVLHRGGPET